MTAPKTPQPPGGTGRTGEPAKPGKSAKPEPAPKSFGNMGEHHWSVARKDQNQEALDYYRQRSHAPGVEEGGGMRNFYCMACDGVIEFDYEGERCPHCDAELEGKIKRYFNWVEIDTPPKSDFKALLPIALIALALLAGAVFALMTFL